MVNKNQGILFLFVFCLFSIGHTQAETSNYDLEYQQLLEQSYSMPEGFDFEHFRDVYTKKSDYRPYRMHPVFNMRPMLIKLDEGEEAAKEARKEIEEYTRKHAALPETHSRAMSAFKDTDKNKAKYHEWMLKGLMKALKWSGDAKSPETAIKVIHISEEYLIARWYMERKTIGQSLKNIDGQVYDVLTGKNKETGEEQSMWFNVTTVFASDL